MRLKESDRDGSVTDEAAYNSYNFHYLVKKWFFDSVFCHVLHHIFVWRVEDAISFDIVQPFL